MLSELEAFAATVPDFEKKEKGELIEYFAYFLTSPGRPTEFKAADILACFKALTMAPYSNISAYLSNGAKLCRSKPSRFRHL
jgi:hypothetical protein